MDRASASPSSGFPAFCQRPAVFWWMLALGVALRLATLGQPIFNNSNLRQTQTAVITQSMIAKGGFTMDGTVNWLGDHEARLLLELPLYNWLVAALHTIVGHLDACGQAVSVLLWAASFLVLQSLWRRLLDPVETFWANFLFLFAPLSLFFGQAFLPEMLIQCVGFAMLAWLWKYVETGSVWHFAALAVTGLLGMLLKAPEILHLYVIILVMIWLKERATIFRKIRYWTALVATAGILRLWSRCIDNTNAVDFPEWTSAKVVELMIGPWIEHLRPLGYLRLLVYVTLFASTAGGMFWVLWGLKEVWQRRRTAFVLAWLASLVFFYVFWAGSTSRVHSYYHLPALGPVCLLFGIGCARCLGTAWARRQPVVARAVIAVVVLAGAVGPCAFLYQQDPVLKEACGWLRQNSAPTDLVLVRINHRTDTSTYRHNSTVAYYANRRIWCWAPELTADQRKRALLTARWALVTQPVKSISRTEQLRRWIKGTGVLVEDMNWLENEGFARHFEGEGFTIYKRKE